MWIRQCSFPQISAVSCEGTYTQLQAKHSVPCTNVVEERQRLALGLQTPKDICKVVNHSS